MTSIYSKTCVLIFAMVFGGNTLAQDFTTTHATEFLAAIEGEWTGRAESTPIGPKPYNITFRNTLENRLEGSTIPGNNVTHSWVFFEENGDLRIRFLSSFAGNKTPVFLEAEQSSIDGVLFRAKELPILSVKVLPTSEVLSIDVFHWNNPHVSIRLYRNE